MRTSSNPAFRNLPTGQGGYAGFDRMGGAAGGAAAYRQTSAPAGLGDAPTGLGHAPTGERALTIDDVVTKTAITAGAALVAGVLTVLAGPAFAWLVLPAFLVGLVISLVVIFKQSSNPALILTYSVAEGIALGGITGMIESASPKYAGIGAQAVIGTVGVFIGMLVVYKTGAVKVTPKFTKWLMGAMVGVVVLMLADFVGGLFGADLGLRNGGPMAIIFSLVVIGVAAFSLLLDFDQADRAIRAGVPATYAWYIAFGLMVTLVWLYLEILRLLSYLRGD
ncbi:MAG: Bax inhibitor-1/YccA family protein [Pseudonocardia sp.]